MAEKTEKKEPCYFPLERTYQARLRRLARRLDLKPSWRARRLVIEGLDRAEGIDRASCADRPPIH